MPAQYTKSISFGSHEDVGGKREALYQKAADKLAGGNMSRLICQIVDQDLGIKLPLPGIGRPKKSESEGVNDGYPNNKKRKRTT